MTNPWDLRPFIEEDMDGLVELCQAQPGKAARINAEYIHWQRNENPAGQAQVGIAYANDIKKVVGVLWFVPLRVQVGEEIVLGSQSLYALVHSDYRGQGIFTGLARLCYENILKQGVQFSYGFPNPNSYPPFIKRLGWQHIGDARLYLRPLNLPRLISRRYGEGMIFRTLGYVSQMTGRVIFHPKSINQTATPFTISEIQPNNPLLDEFWESIKHKYPVMLVRDTDFLNWRYGKIPERRYRLWAAIHKGEMVGLVIFRDVIIQGIACGMIVDFLVEPTPLGHQSGEILIQEAIHHFESQDLDLVGCMMLSHSEETRLLARQGFILCPTWLQPQPIPVILKANVEISGKILLNDIRAWFLTMGDYDVV